MNGIAIEPMKALGDALEVAFPGTKYNVDSLPRMRIAGDMVIVKVYANLESLDFQERRHKVFTLLRASGMGALCDRLSISQYRQGG